MTFQQRIALIIVGTLAAVILGVVIVLLYGLFDPRVDNKEIFDILKGSFQTIIGCFVGFLGGQFVARKEREGGGDVP